MINPESNKSSEVFIYNIKTYKFNNGGLSPASFKPGGTRRALFDYLMNSFHLPSKKSNQRIKSSFENGIKKTLGLKGFVNIQNSSVYELKFSKKRIDEFLEDIFWRFFEIKKYDWRSEWNKGKSPVLNRIYQYYELKGRSFIESGISPDLTGPKFIIYLTDQSRKVKALKRVIIDKNLLSYCKDNFINLYNEFQNINHSRIVAISNGITFGTLQSNSIQFGFGKLTSQFTKFATESNKEGITRAIAVIVQNKDFRMKCTEISKKHHFLNFLDLSKVVRAEEKWGNIVTNGRNTMDFPDIVTFCETTGVAKEKIQLKVLPFIPTKFIRYRYEEIISDYLKSISCYDPVTNTGLVSFRIEYIPPNTFIKSLSNSHSNDHKILVHYWGNLDSKFQRLGEIYNSIRIAIYNHNIIKENEIIRFVKKKLRSGKEMLSGRELLEIDEELILELFSIYKDNMTEREFIYQLITKIITELM